MKHDFQRLFLVPSLVAVALLGACQTPGAVSDQPPAVSPRPSTASRQPSATLTPLPTPVIITVVVSPTNPPPNSPSPIPSATADYQTTRLPDYPTITPTRLPSPTPTPFPPGVLFPDSEVIYAASAADFDAAGYLTQAGGFLDAYRQYLTDTEWNSGAQIVMRMAVEHSLNPRLLLALLEYQSGCVLGQPPAESHGEALMGAAENYRKDLYGQLAWTAQTLSTGYYGWRDGTLAGFPLAGGKMISPPASANAGTVALQYFFAQLYDGEAWQQALDPIQGFPALYASLFGDAWERAHTTEPLVPAGLAQPLLTLPFEPGKLWSFSGGPHAAFHQSGPLAALDFAPASGVSGCAESAAWVVASAPGVVTRSEPGVVALDLDGENGTEADGREQSGWVLVYLHLATQDRIPAGVRVQVGDNLGHPSCEGGTASGTHVHLARKFNGEWITADGPIPFVLSGWTAHAGDKPYEGTLTKEGEITVIASIYGLYESRITREGENP